MRSFLSLPLLIVFSMIPTNACVKGDNVSNIVKVNCDELDTIKLTRLPSSIRIQSYCGDYNFKEEALVKTLEMFVQEYSDTFEIDEAIVWLYLHDLRIEFSAIPRIVRAAFSVDGKPLVGDVPVSGLALSPKHIWVEIKTSQIWSSSLIHELVHIVIWNQNSGIHGDPDHEGKNFSGWTKKHTTFIKNLNNQLLDMEI